MLEGKIPFTRTVLLPVDLESKIKRLLFSRELSVFCCPCVILLLLLLLFSNTKLHCDNDN